MLTQRILLYILLVMLARSNNQAHGFNATNCSAEIHIKRHSKCNTHVGGSLTMKCPLRYCKTKPSMKWCKMQEATCVMLEEGRAGWESDLVFTLEIFPVHQNHSGRFRCRAKDGTLVIESHEIQVVVEEKPPNLTTVSPENTTTISEESQEFGNYKILLIASAPVGLCCLCIIGCLFWCPKRCHANQKRTPLTQQKEEILVKSPAVGPFHAAGTTPPSAESSSLHRSMASPLQVLKDNVIYDNAVPPWNAQRTAPDAPYNIPVIPPIPVLPESPDVLTYAELNHSASAGRCQRREQTAVNEITEYACIHVHQ